MGFFYTYMRPLVEAGKLYRANAPLYTIKQGKEEFYFYRDKDYREWLATNPTSFSVLRGKGVGELDAGDLHRLCFASERFKRLNVENLEESTKLLNIFLGKDIVPRRNYIYENAAELGFSED